MKWTALLVLPLISACSGNTIPDTGSGLPKKPEKIVIRWYSGGGMLPEGEDIYISADSCYWHQWQDDCQRTLYFSLSEDEIRSLYQVFTDHAFDRIAVTAEQEVYDRGGTSIDIMVDQVFYEKSNLGMSFVEPESRDDYAAIENAVYDVAVQKTEHYKTEGTVRFTDALLNSGLRISLTINSDFETDSETGSLAPVVPFSVYAGANQFTVSLFDPDSLNSYGFPTCLTTVWFTKTISDTSNLVTFDYQDGILTGR